MITQKDKDDSFYEQVTRHSLCVERPYVDASTIYQMKEVTAKPIDNSSADLDLRCFPTLVLLRGKWTTYLSRTALNVCRLCEDESKFEHTISFLLAKHH